MSRYAPMYEMCRPYVYESVWMANARREDTRRQRTVHGGGRTLREGDEDPVIELERGVTELPILAVSTETWRAAGPQGERDEREVTIERGGRAEREGGAERGDGKERVWTYEPQRTGRDEASQSVERVCSRRGEWRVAGRVVKREKVRERREDSNNDNNSSGRNSGNSRNSSISNGNDSNDSRKDSSQQEDRLPAAVVGAVERHGVQVCGHWSARKREAVEVAAFTVQYVVESERGEVQVQVVPYLADRDEIAAKGSVVYERETRVLRGRGDERREERGERKNRQAVETTVVAHIYAMQEVPRGEWSWYIRHDVTVGEERATLRLVTVSGTSFLRRQ